MNTLCERGLSYRLIRRNKIQLTTVLQELGVDCINKKPFFILNESRLDYIFYDFQKAARHALAKAHPDAGGNTAEFQNLKSNIEMVRRSFGRVGIGPETSLQGSPANSERKVSAAQAAKLAEHYKTWRTEIRMYYHLRRLMMRDGVCPPPRGYRRKKKSAC